MSNQTLTTMGAYQDPEIEEKFINFEIDTDTTMPLMGENDGAANNPDSFAHWMASVFMPQQAKAQQLVDFTQQKLQPIAGVVTNTENDVVRKGEAMQLSADVQNLVVKEAAAAGKLNNIHQDKGKRVIRAIVLVAVVILGGADGFMAFDSLINGGMSGKVAIIYGLVITIVLTLGSELLAAFALRTKNVKLRAFRLAVGCIVAGIIFYYLGIMRAAGYNTDASVPSTSSSEIAITSNIHVCPCVISAIGMLLFLACLFFSFVTAKDEKEKADSVQAKKLANELNDISESIRVKKERISQLQEDALHQSKISKQQYEYCISCRRRAISIVEGGLSKYIQGNLKSRTEPCPDFFYPSLR